MMSFVLSLTSILLLANALLLGIALLVIMRFRRESAAQLAFWQSPLGSALATTGDGDASADETVRQVAQSLMRLEHQMLRMRRDVLRDSAGVHDAAEPLKATKAPTASTALPLEHAVRMARHGASIEDLTRSCGLTPGEARLMKKLHGKVPTTH